MKTLDNFIYGILVCRRGPGSNTVDAEQSVAVVSRFISAVDVSQSSTCEASVHDRLKP